MTRYTIVFHPEGPGEPTEAVGLFATREAAEGYAKIGRVLLLHPRYAWQQEEGAIRALRYTIVPVQGV